MSKHIFLTACGPVKKLFEGCFYYRFPGVCPYKKMKAIRFILIDN